MTGTTTEAASVDAAIRRVFDVALTPEQAVGQPNCVVLAHLKEELETDGMGEAACSLLDADKVDRVIVARLIESPPDTHPQTPLQYLVCCFARASQEPSKHDAAAAAMRTCRELIISYSTLCLMGGIIPHPDPQAAEAEARGGLQLLECMDASMGLRTAPAGAVPLPPGFLEALSAKYESDGNMEGLQEVLRPVVCELAKRVRACSALGEYTVPLNGVRMLVGMDTVARALVHMPQFLPNLRDVTGRGIESPGSSWLGACFCPSAIDDPLVRAQPAIGEQCFANPDTRRPGDIQQSMRALQMASKQIHAQLGAIVKLGKHTRDATIKWLAATIEGNAERGKMQWKPELGASHGFFLNHNATMLLLCGPFMESPNFWKRVDVRYVAHNARIEFKEDTKLSATTAEDAAWRQQVATQAGSSAPEYHFICECFFMTLKSLHYGLVKMMDDLQALQMNMSYMQGDLQALEAEAQRLQGSPMSMAVQLQLQRAKAQFAAMQGTVYSMSTVLQDQDFMTEVLAFYRLTAAWLLSVANPNSGGLGANALPLPDTPPVQWTCLPEWFLEDILDVLIMVSRVYPPLLMNAKVDEIMMLMLATIDQPKYVRSSHMRAKMAELLHVWLPQDDVQQPGRTRRMAPRGQLASTLSHLFQGHPLVCERLVPALLRLYVDVEVMDVRNSFYEKFMFRQYIGEVLAHLWELPPHKEAWKRFAQVEGTGTAGYVRFVNMLITDATYLLDESLKKVSELKEKSAKLADPSQTATLSPQERHELETSITQTGGHLKALLAYAQVNVAVINFSTEEVTATFLLPEMVDRTAGMLDYFLSLLTGPKRKALALKDPEKYNFRPRELLRNLIRVYLHLSSADSSRAFHAAVARDQRSYCPTMFSEAARVLATAGMLGPADAAQLDAMAMAIQRAADSAAEEDDLLQGVEVPEEFQDPLLAELMTDPVLLPSSGRVMDRAIITRHLLTDQRDPMSRAPLTPEELVPQPELKARIEAWVRDTKAKQTALRRAGAPTVQPTTQQTPDSTGT